MKPLKPSKPVTPNRYGTALPAKPMSPAPTKVGHPHANLGKFLHPKGKH